MAYSFIRRNEVLWINSCLAGTLAVNRGFGLCGKGIAVVSMQLCTPCKPFFGGVWLMGLKVHCRRSGQTSPPGGER